MDESFIIAIDFGTAYSGYAFSMTSREKEIDPYLKRWGEEVGQDTAKTPTCILFDENEKFLKFGYEARTEYLRMSAKKAQKHFYFECFKMSLYGKVSQMFVICRILYFLCFKYSAFGIFLIPQMLLCETSDLPKLRTYRLHVFTL